MAHFPLLIVPTFPGFTFLVSCTFWGIFPFTLISAITNLGYAKGYKNETVFFNFIVDRRNLPTFPFSNTFATKIVRDSEGQTVGN